LRNPKTISNKKQEEFFQILLRQSKALSIMIRRLFNKIIMLASSYIIVRDVRGADLSYSNACGEIMKELLLSERKK